MAMAEHATYKTIDLVGVSEIGSSEAVQNAVTRASQTVKGLDWFEVTQVRGVFMEGTVYQFQVGVKIGFPVMSEEELRSE
jgi:flavin-binding protein dodecin